MIYQNGKYKRRRTSNLNYPKLQHGEETTLTLCIFFSSEPQEVFIGTKGKGARGTTPGPKYGRGRARRPQKHGHSSVFMALLEPHAAPAIARCRVCPLSAAGPDFLFWAPIFDESALQSQWLYYRPLITH